MITAMPRKRSPGRPRKHGGRRAGAGRKRLEGVGTQVVSVTLTPQHVAKVERWQDEHDVETFSEAVRQIIDAVQPG